MSKEHTLYKQQIKEFDHNGNFLINVFIKNHLNELNPIGINLQVVLNNEINQFENNDSNNANTEEKNYEDFN
ncbi:hypothetical protein J6P11_05230 [bacterium]|nr:hypothetical protein [bacterium]